MVLGFLSGDQGVNYLEGSDELNDNILGLGGDDRLLGLGGNDFLDGGDGDDTLEGGKGNDTLFGGPGNDRMLGGEDNDTYYVDSREDKVIERAREGLDTVFSTAPLYELPDHVENGVADGWFGTSRLS